MADWVKCADVNMCEYVCVCGSFGVGAINEMTIICPLNVASIQP